MTDTKHAGREIRTSFEFPPIPIRSLDWLAWFDGGEEGGPVGHGATEAEAIANLKEKSEDE